MIRARNWQRRAQPVIASTAMTGVSRRLSDSARNKFSIAMGAFKIGRAFRSDHAHNGALPQQRRNRDPGALFRSTRKRRPSGDDMLDASPIWLLGRGDVPRGAPVRKPREVRPRRGSL